MGKDFLYLVAVPFVVIIGNLIMEAVKSIVAKRADERKENKERQERADTSLLELRKIEETTEIELLKQVIARGQPLEIYVDDLRKRTDERLTNENKVFARENFELRQNLTSAMLAFELLKHGAAVADVIAMVDRIRDRMEAWRKETEREI
jgi:hypothetical protein